MHLHRRARSFAPLGLSLSLAACGPDHRQQLHTDLPSEGYALFRVEAGGAKRIAVVFELRDVPEGELVLLYSPSEPQSSGWFAIDPAQYAPCRQYGADAAVDDIELGCVVPGGRGALVDVQAASPGSEQLLLRHQLLAKGGYYAVMRVEKTGPTLPINVEVSSMDAEPFDPPNVERVR
jgi:hypothetical protein